MVTPEQFLLEYGYVYNKSVELGYGELTKWEKAFLNNFNTTYLSSPKYKPYIDNYILPLPFLVHRIETTQLHVHIL